MNHSLHAFFMLCIIAATGWSIAYQQLKKDAIQGDESLIKMQIHNKHDKSIILFGDSVIDFWNPKKDKHWTSVADFLEKTLNIPVLNASQSGQKIIAVNQLLQLLGAAHKEPYQAIIVQLNPVMLAREEEPAQKKIWERRIQFQTEKHLSLLTLFEFAALKEYKGSGRPRLEASPLESAASDLDPYTILRICQKFKVKQPIQEADLLSELEQLKFTAKQYTQHLIFFINPVDLKTIQEAAGDDYAHSIQSRITLCKKSCEALNLPCFDFHNLIQGSHHFFDPHRVHLDEASRQKLAQSIAHALKEQGVS